MFDIEVIRDGRSVSLSVTLEEEEPDRPTGPRAYRRVPRGFAPAIIAPQIAPRIVPRIAPLIRQRVRLAPAVVEVQAVAPAIAVVPALAPLVVSVPVAPSPARLTAPVVNVAPVLAPLPDLPLVPRPVLAVPMKDDVI